MMLVDIFADYHHVGGWTRTDRHVAVENVRKPPASGQRTMKLFWQVQPRIRFCALHMTICLEHHL